MYLKLKIWVICSGGCESFNQPLKDWNISNVTIMNHIFAYCKSFNQDISNWDVSNVKDIRRMFYECPIEKKYKPKNTF